MTSLHPVADPHAAPPIVRRALWAVLAVLLAGSGYLIAVRGEALLADLAALGSRVWCF